jgi:hypothetical protein
MKVSQPSVAAVRLITLSGLMLFVELALIRWTGSNLVYLSYFSNFVLLGSFLGIGVGFLRAKSTGDIFQWASVVLALLVGFTLIFPVQIECGGSEIIFFGCSPSGLPIWLTLPVVFLAVAAVMASIAQGVGRAFVGFDPLDAYRLDIVGSLVGIVAFTILSFLGAPPLAWGCIVVAVLAFFYLPDIRLVQIVSFGAILFLLGKESFEPHLSWSPYYKIELTPQSNGMQSLSVNGIPHQMIESIAQRKRSEPIYLFPYKRIVHNPLDNVLIVGAGNGVDVALALAAGAKHVDAVEIDPRILQIGHRFNPNHPYQDPRVTAYNDDGRAFLQKSHSSYDLILFALPDSLSLVSGQSSLRLESYLFTIESMRAARALLKPDGAYGMYNYYRQTWLIDRLAHTLELAYGHRPCVDSTKGNVGRFSLLIVGREAANVRCAATWAPTVRDVPVPADDDHPFLYLRTPSIPQLYLIAIASILLASLIVIRVATGPLAQMRGYHAARNEKRRSIRASFRHDVVRQCARFFRRARVRLTLNRSDTPNTVTSVLDLVRRSIRKPISRMAYSARDATCAERPYALLRGNTTGVCTDLLREPRVRRALQRLERFIDRIRSESPRSHARRRNRICIACRGLSCVVTDHCGAICNRVHHSSATPRPR